MVHSYTYRYYIVRGKTDDAGREKSWGNREKMGTNDKVEEMTLDRTREDRSTMVIGVKEKKRNIRFTNRTCQILFFNCFYVSVKLKARLILRNEEVMLEASEECLGGSVDQASNY